jgi:hypothetical protein
MFKNSLNLILVLFTLSVTNVSATLITSEDFTSGATGWSNNSTSFINGDRVLGGFNLFGAGAFAQKTFSLSGNQTSVNINLDFWKGDSWDNESFFVHIDGNLLFSQSYMYYHGTQVAGQPHANWNELLVPISLNYNTTATSLTVRFSSSLNQSPNDEWWAVDNVVINDNAVVNNVSVPEPSTLAIFALGIMGLVSRRSFLLNKKQ